MSFSARVAAQPSLVVTQKEAGKGRGLYWDPVATPASACPKFTPLLDVDPTVCALDRDQLSVRCSYCFRKPTKELTAGEPSSFHTSTVAKRAKGLKLRRCGGCKIAHYCGGKCQRMDWAFVHHLECQALSLWQERARSKGSQASPGTVTSAPTVEQRETIREVIPDSHVRLLARIRWTGKLDEKQMGIVSFNDLESHFDKDPLRSTVVQTARKVDWLVALAHWEPGTSLSTPVSEHEHRMSCEMVSRVRTNAFALTDGEQTSIGLSISPLVAMANHSCVPNANYSYPEDPGPSGSRCMRLLTLRDIEPGEEILVSYVDVAEPYHRRNNTLRNTYFFVCQCRLCADFCSLGDSWRRDKVVERTEVDPRHTGLCVHCKEASIMMPEDTTEQIDSGSVRCGKCGTEIPKALLTRVVQKMSTHSQLNTSEAALADITKAFDPEWKTHWTTKLKPALDTLSATVAFSHDTLLSTLTFARKYLTAVSAFLSAQLDQLPVPAATSSAAAAETSKYAAEREGEWLTVQETCLVLLRLEVHALTSIGGETPIYPDGHAAKALLLVEFAKCLDRSLVTAAASPQPQHGDGGGGGGGGAGGGTECNPPSSAASADPHAAAVFHWWQQQHLLPLPFLKYRVFLITDPSKSALEAEQDLLKRAQLARTFARRAVTAAAQGSGRAGERSVMDKPSSAATRLTSPSTLERQAVLCLQSVEGWIAQHDKG